MTDRFIRDLGGTYKAWSIDQITKSEFFHQKLHEWGLRDVADAIENVRGESLDWGLENLGITEPAWNKIIHRGIKPVIVFAHPAILQSVPRSVGYYRMLAMVSQKSMNNIRLPVNRYENGNAFPGDDRAWGITNRLNQIISALIQADDDLNPREFDLWRGMAAGAQADGSWRNLKGKKAEVAVKGAVLRRLRAKEIVKSETETEFRLNDGRVLVFADEPDVAIYHQDSIRIAIEVKGGIDTAGILERIGAAIKSLSRAREENPNSVTILLVQGVSMTQRAVDDLAINQDAVNHWFTVEDFFENNAQRERVFHLMRI
ncbi:MAG: XcyI family restriction endonuclease [Anaerolineales bacterium]